MTQTVDSNEIVLILAYAIKLIAEHAIGGTFQTQVSHLSFLSILFPSRSVFLSFSDNMLTRIFTVLFCDDICEMYKPKLTERTIVGHLGLEHTYFADTISILYMDFLKTEWLNCLLFTIMCICLVMQTPSL